MDPPPVEGSGRRASGRGGKGRGGSRLGMKTAPSPKLSPSPASSLAPPPIPPPPLISAPATPTPAPAMPNPVPAAPTPAHAVPTSSHAAPPSTVPPRPPQGAGWGAIPPNFTSLHGNQQGPNSWVYPPGGFLNFIQPQGEFSFGWSNYELQPDISITTKCLWDSNTPSCETRYFN